MIAGLIYDFKIRFPLLSFITFRVIAMLFLLLILGLAVFFLMSLTPGDIVDNYVISTSQEEYKNDIYEDEED